MNTLRITTLFALITALTAVAAAGCATEGAYDDELGGEAVEALTDPASGAPISIHLSSDIHSAFEGQYSRTGTALCWTFQGTGQGTLSVGAVTGPFDHWFVYSGLHCDYGQLLDLGLRTGDDPTEIAGIDKVADRLNVSGLDPSQSSFEGEYTESADTGDAINGRCWNSDDGNNSLGAFNFGTHYWYLIDAPNCDLGSATGSAYLGVANSIDPTEKSAVDRI